MGDTDGVEANDAERIVCAVAQETSSQNPEFAHRRERRGTHWQPNLRKLGGGWGLRAAGESPSPLRFEMPACRTPRMRHVNARPKKESRAAARWGPCRGSAGG